jgi:hypothetical protein
MMGPKKKDFSANLVEILLVLDLGVNFYFGTNHLLFTYLQINTDYKYSNILFDVDGEKPLGKGLARPSVQLLVADVLAVLPEALAAHGEAVFFNAAAFILGLFQRIINSNYVKMLCL